eukprot:GEMP01071649.1.p1 GENE.GEMP01071649.1~~GEMP01071649.1.p1  ORF type:complete len:210 (+),score=30.76 GEMP01071649.1:45-674(+)
MHVKARNIIGESCERGASNCGCVKKQDTDYCKLHDYTNLQSGKTWPVGRGGKVHTNMDILRYRERMYCQNRDKAHWTARVGRHMYDDTGRNRSEYALRDASSSLQVMIPSHSLPSFFTALQPRTPKAETTQEVYERQTGLKFREPVPMESVVRLTKEAFKAQTRPPDWAYSSLPYYLHDRNARTSTSWDFKELSMPPIAFPKLGGMGSA